MRTWRTYAIVLSAVILIQAASRPALAEVTKGTWEVGLFASFATYDNGSTLDDSITFGGRGAYFFKDAHGVEIDLNIGSTDVNTAGSNADFDLRRISLNYIHNFQLKRESRLQPILLAGFGYFNIDDGMNDDTATTLQIGGGSRITISPRLVVRIDATLFRWRGDRVVTMPDDFFSFEITAGISFLIGAGE